MNKQRNNGKFVISLDFELLWGVHDTLRKEEYFKNILGAHEAVKNILDIFERYNIKATWAVVGMLYLKNEAEFYKHIPTIIPQYENLQLSPYHYIQKHPIQKCDHRLFFANELISKIEQTPYQNIASHTYAHYYCLEKGHTLQSFTADIKKFQEISNNKRMTSIIFPRNQINKDYLDVCHTYHFRAYRGNEKGWIYRIKQHDRKHFIKRGLRFLDTYVNLFGLQTYPLSQIQEDKMLNIRGSRFLKPVSTRLYWLEKRRLQRILREMTSAAKYGEVYHLWWHPHNFGINLKENMYFLQQILEHYTFLSQKYDFKSENMESLTEQIVEMREIN